MNRRIVLLFTLLFYSQFIIADQVTDSLTVLLDHAKKAQQLDIRIEMAQYLLVSDPDLAREYATEALKQARAKKIVEKQIGCQNIIGQTFAIQNKYVSALDWFHQALSMAQKNQEGLLMASSLKLSAEVYFTKANYEEAIKYYHNAIQIIQKTQNFKELGYLYLQIGKSFYLSGDLAQAQGSYTRAVEQAGKGKANDIQADGLLGMADIQIANENWVNAKQLTFEALKRVKNPHLYIKAYNHLASIYLFENEKKKAVSALKKALEKAEYNKLTDQEANLYLQISEIYAENKDWEAANTYMQLHKTKTVDMLAENYQDDMYIMRQQYDNKFNQQKQNFSQTEKKQWWKLTISFITNLLLIAGFGFILWKYQLLQKKMQKNDTTAAEQLKQIKTNEKQAKSAKKETNNLKTELAAEMIQREQLEHELDRVLLKTDLLAIAHKNGAYAQLKDELSNLDENQTKFKIEELKKNWALETEIEKKDWNIILEKLNDLYPDFYTLFSETFEQLTENEMRHVVFMKLGLSTKDIADLANIGVRGVQTARYRIKKKMELSQEEDLITYIQNFSV